MTNIATLNMPNNTNNCSKVKYILRTKQKKLGERERQTDRQTDRDRDTEREARQATTTTTTTTTTTKR